MCAATKFPHRCIAAFRLIVVLITVLPEANVVGAFEMGNNGANNHHQWLWPMETHGKVESLPKSPALTSVTCDSRRRAFKMVSASILGSVNVPLPSHAGLFPEKPKRQLELCVVSLLRILYWAENAAKDLRSEDPDRRRQRYLEARLASKAMVSGKLGGGSNYQVMTLKSLQLKECLLDLVSYVEDQRLRRQAIDLQTDLLEALASVVEFDGLESTVDSSPRSSLTMTMYTEAKATFVRRTLEDRVVPTTNSLIRLFPQVEDLCVAYIQKTYPDEVPMAAQPTSVGPPATG
jgi:hypothetical protein